MTTVSYTHLDVYKRQVRTNTLEGYARMVNRYIVGPIGQMYMDEVTTDDPVSYTHLDVYKRQG